MKSSNFFAGVAPAPGAEKCSITQRRLAGVSRAKSSFVFVASNCHIAMKLAINPSSADGLLAAPADPPAIP
jgi:hypothetical protein